MSVIAIHLGAMSGGELSTMAAVRAVCGKGLEGDRYFFPDGAPPGRALTLVERDVVRDAGLEQGMTRRQLTVDGVDLNSLVGKGFRVGAVECYGVQLCEPCLHLQKMTRPGILKALVHRAGLNADILSDGVIKVGDVIEET